MKNFAYALVLAALIPACSSDDGSDHYTWGDASVSISDSYCAALVGCGYGGDDEWFEQCSRHSKYHLCDLNMSCDEELPAGAEASVDVCVATLGAEAFSDPASSECFYLTYLGVLPEECSAALELNPEDQSE